MTTPLEFSCTVPTAQSGDVVLLAHGEGGLLSRRLLQQRLAPQLASAALDFSRDAALLPSAVQPLAISTDSFVVTPLFFPGGDIGKLAVFGTCNDLAVAGARPRYLTLSLILEEGLPLDTLDRVLSSIAAAAKQTEVAIVAGDTKVVPRGACDGMFINTTGVGEQLLTPAPHPALLQPGDALIASGPIASHGMAVLGVRENLGFTPPIASDCAPLWPAVQTLAASGIIPHALRDATRGGVAAVLHEWAEASELTLAIDEASLPILPRVRAACELLGLDPLHVANEGMMLLAVTPSQVDATLAALHAAGTVTAQATVVGAVRPRGPFAVIVRRGLGTHHPLDEPLGAPLPRIC